MQIALVADSHLAERAPQCVDNWHACARAVAAARADFTVHLGDISLDGANQTGEIRFAADLLRQWPTPMQCVPGNHDMGTGSGEEPLMLDAFLASLEAFGIDRWTQTVDGWTLIGINAQLFGTESEHEAAQRAWIEATARGLRPGDRVILFSHRPLLRPVHDAWMPTGRYVHRDSARWLLEGPLRHHLRAVVSGHVHQALSFEHKRVQHIWVPSSSFVFNDALQHPIGQKFVGIGWLDLSGGRLVYRQITPPDAEPHELTTLPFYPTANTRTQSHRVLSRSPLGARFPLDSAALSACRDVK